MKTGLILISITLIITLVGTTTLIAQKIPQGHLSVPAKSDSQLWIQDSIEYSPDGKILATTVGYRGEITLYNAQNGDELENFAIPQGVRCFAFSPNSKLMATGSYNSNVRVWDTGDVANGIGLRLRYNEASFLFGHKAAINCIAFSPDGKHLASGSMDKTIRIWDVATGKHILTIKASMGVVYDVVYSPDGSMIAAGCWGSAYLFDAITGREIHFYDQRGATKAYTSTVTAMTFSPNGEILITGNSGGAVHAWNVETGKHIRRLILTQGRNHKFASINYLTFSPDDNTLACMSSDGNIYLWDTNMQNRPKILSGVSGRGMAYSPDGNTIATVGYNQISFWDVNTGRNFGLKNVRTRYELEDR